jgi:integrase
LEPGSTKNDRGREFPFTDELEAALREQRAYTDQVERTQGMICRHVFHRKGKPIRCWRRRWLQALLKVGLAQLETNEDGTPKKRGKIIPAVLIHDFRRTSIRALALAGVSEGVGMKLCGHETRSIYDRYRIVTGDDLREAAAKLNTATAKVSAKVAVVSDTRAAHGRG